ncbi:MAG: FtsX-like permease family protein [Candidatus Bathyarchaeia archaeon]
MRIRNNYLPQFLVLLFIFSNSLLSYVTAQPQIAQSSINFLPVVERARQDFALVRELVNNFSNMGSRFTTYPGYEHALEFIETWFRRYLVNVEVQRYNLTLIVDYGASLTVEGSDDQFTLYPLVPNSVVPVRTPEEGITGQLVYVGSGDLSELEGKKIKDSIVIMDFNSGMQWLEVAKLGAKAVIFLEPIQTLREQAFAKYLDDVPLNFPRFYIQSGDGLRLLSLRGMNVTLKGDTRWEDRTADNIMGWVKGSKYPDKHVIIATYFDAYSVVPSLATGASESCSIASLLALAKYYSENPPEVSVVFVAFSGHNQGLWGEREWIEKYIFGPDRNHLDPLYNIYWRNESLAENGLAVFSISILPDTDLLYPFGVGGYYTQDQIVTFPTTPTNKLLDVYYALVEQTGKDYGLTPAGHGTFYDLVDATTERRSDRILSPKYNRWMPGEVLLHVTKMGRIFGTGRAWAWLYGTPVDTYENVEQNLEKVEPQLELLYVWLHYLLNTDILRTLPENQPASHWITGGTKDAQGRTALEQAHRAKVSGQAFIHGSVLYLDTFQGRYLPIPASPNQTILIKVTGSWVSRTLLVIKAKPDGSWNIIGNPYFWRSDILKLSAYVLDENNSITYVTDSGMDAIPVNYPYDAEPGLYNTYPEIKLSVFKCASAVIFDYVDPYYLDNPAFDLSVAINYIDTHVQVNRWHYIREYHKYGESLCMIFFEPDVPLEFLVNGMTYGRTLPITIFCNASAEVPNGAGYTLKAGEQIPFSIYNFTHDIYYIDSSRIDVAVTVGAGETSVEVHQRIRSYLDTMKEKLSIYSYKEAQNLAFLAWNENVRLYVDIRVILEGVINTVPFFAAILIPLVFLLERLLFSTEGKKRIITIILLFSITFGIFSVLHPGFKLSSNILVVLISFAIIVLTIPALAITYDRAMVFLRKMRRKILGPHFVEVSKGSIVMSSFSTGVAYMRKRRMRTILTLASILITCMGIVMFTMVSTEETVGLIQKAAEPNLAYEGILVQRESFGAAENFMYGIGVKMTEFLEEFGKRNNVLVSPRVWIYPSYMGETINAGFLIEKAGDTETVPYVVKNLIGLTPQEDEITQVSAFFSEKFPASRWFVETDVWAIIIHEKTAAALNISSIPTTVTISGIPVTVVGVFTDGLRAIKDINEWKSLFPRNFEFADFPIPIDAELAAIIPYKLALLMPEYFSGVYGGITRYFPINTLIASVALKPSDPSRIPDMAAEIADRFRGRTLQTWVYVNQTQYVVGIRSGISLGAGATHFIPLILAVLVVMSTMIGNVMERKKDISIFSTIGLSPLHVAIMFIAETLVYAVIGGIFGYIGAMVFATLATRLFDLMIIINYTSSWVTLALGLAMLVTLASSIYPIIQSSRLVTPSMERRWQIPTKPYRDEWDIPIPFVANDHSEAVGILNYMYEFFSNHASPIAPDFSVSRISSITRKDVEGGEAFLFESTVMVAPYESGLEQTVILQALPQENRWIFNLHLTRLRGERNKWTLLNRTFCYLLREQLLLWRSLRDQEKEKYKTIV